MVVYVNIEGKFEDFISMCGWKLEDLGNDLYKIIGSDESYLIEHPKHETYYIILSPVTLDIFTAEWYKCNQSSI